MERIEDIVKPSLAALRSAVAAARGEQPVSVQLWFGDGSETNVVAYVHFAGHKAVNANGVSIDDVIAKVAARTERVLTVADCYAAIGVVK